MKYIIFKNDNGLETALIFPNHVPHINMSGDTSRSISHWGPPRYTCPDLGEPVSAGFLCFDEDGGILCDGASDSLKLDSRPEDTAIVVNEIQRRAYHVDPLARAK